MCDVEKCVVKRRNMWYLQIKKAAQAAFFIV